MLVGTRTDTLVGSDSVDLMERTETDISLMVFIKVEDGDSDDVPVDSTGLLLDNCNPLHDVTDGSGELVVVSLS